ncbi:hypothetical protein AB4254_11160 [Vibrio breoganii]
MTELADYTREEIESMSEEEVQNTFGMSLEEALDEWDELNPDGEYTEEDEMPTEEEEEDETEFDEADEDVEQPKSNKSTLMIAIAGALTLSLGGFFAFQHFTAKPPIAAQQPDFGFPEFVDQQPLPQEIPVKEAATIASSETQLLIEPTEVIVAPTQLPVPVKPTAPEPKFDIEALVAEVLDSEELQLHIAEQTQAIKLPHDNNKDVEVLRSQLKAIQEDLSKLATKIESETPDFSSINAKLTALTAEISTLKKQKPTQESVSNRLGKDELDALKKGKIRFSGFVVAGTTGDGKQSIVKTPTNRVNVYDVGDIFYVNKKRFSVTGIHDSGYFVVVDNKYFIDTLHTPLIRAETKPTVSQPTVKKTQPKAKSAPVEPKAKAKESSIPSNQLSTKKHNGRTIAVGYSMNGEYTDGYIVMDPTGKWETVRIGSRLENLGRVTGTDKDGNLLIGDIIIMAAE